MAVTISDIAKLRKLTGAGMMDCKKALIETNNDVEAAIEIIRAKGQAVAAKRSDREASEGCVLCKAENGFAAIIALKCETDFVANNADFKELTKKVLDAAVAAKCATLDEVKALTIDGVSAEQAVVNLSGITGEKMELDGYNTLTGDYISVYNHQGKNTLCTMVSLSTDAPAEYGHGVAMQIAAMNPVSISEADVPEEVKERELQTATEKTKEEQVKKAVEAALKKAGINPSHVDSEDHMESNQSKGWITAEDVAKAKEIIATVSAEKAANLPAAMIEKIAQGRMNKFYKDSCLLNQDYIMDGTKTVAAYLKEANKDCTVLAFKRFTLRSE